MWWYGNLTSPAAIVRIWGVKPCPADEPASNAPGKRDTPSRNLYFSRALVWISLL